MARRPLWILTGIVAAAVIVAAGAIGLMDWQAARQNTQAATSPNVTSILPPSWTAGQAWTYNVSLTRIAPEVIGSYGDGLHGVVTETVLGTVPTAFGDAYNVSLAGTFAMQGAYSIAAPQSIGAANVSVHGYVWYRTSDLATIEAVRWVHFQHSTTVDNMTWTTDLSASIRIDYDPPLATWQFPLQSNESWNVSSNASVRYASAFELNGPNVTFGTTHYANATIPIRFHMETFEFSNVTTPAGTFWSLQASTLVGPVVMQLPDRGTDEGVNATTDLLTEPLHPIANLWFSAQVGNVVSDVNWFGPVRYEANLVAYST